MTATCFSIRALSCALHSSARWYIFKIQFIMTKACPELLTQG